MFVDDVKEGYARNVQRLQLNIGRIEPKERRRKRQIEAEQYAVDILPDRVRKGSSPGFFQVQSHSSADLYDIAVNNEEMMRCIGNNNRNLPCIVIESSG